MKATQALRAAAAATLLALALMGPASCARPAGTSGERTMGRDDNRRNYPSFSWDRIPLYMHIRKATSFSDDEIAFIARFPLITFEKANGHKDHGSVEKGALIAARAVKKINPDATILYYRNVMVHYGDYDANKGFDALQGAFLVDSGGNDKLVRGRLPAYDLSSPGVRRWWVESCRSVVADPAIDGVFLDGNIKALEPGYLARQIGAAKKERTIAGYHLMMADTRSAIGPGKLMVANLIRARFARAGLEYMHHFDGSYIEGSFRKVGGTSYEDYVVKGIEAMRQAAREGRIIAFTSALAQPGNTSEMGIDEGHAKVASDAAAREALLYPLAVFLVCAEEYSYFRVHEGNSADADDRWMRWFPEYDRPLGPPAGPAARKGLVYTRSFAHADVRLDIGARRGEIVWR